MGAAVAGICRSQPLSAAPARLGPIFEEISPETSGISWIHENAKSPERYLPESLGPGCAFLDYDNDGWMDIYLVNSGPSDFYTPKQPLRNALYKNNRDGTFTDVTEKAGVAAGTTFGMGVAAADYDNDGRLDLFVCSFVDYTNKPSCGVNKTGQRYYCIPRLFKPTHSFLFHNNGDGTFTDVTRGTAIERALGKGLGVVATDINNDGRVDLFVANDTVQDFLFVNRGNNKWEEISLLAEVAYSESGRARSGMGVDAADINGDGWEDLFVSNINDEMFSLYTNNKNETFFDAAHKHGIAADTRLLSGWGLKFFDYDNDGLVDLILANGHPDDSIEQNYARVKYKEPLLLYHQEQGLLHNVTSDGGPVFSKPLAARGLAVADYDNDGFLDVLVGANGGAPVLLHNRCESGNHWLGVKLVGTTCNRDAIGARLTWSAGGVKRTRLKNSGGSYLSSHDPREVLGLGAAQKIDWLEIKWPLPSGKVQRFTDLPIDRYVTIVEGKSTI